MTDHIPPQQKLEDKLAGLKSKFDMDEFGTVNENGHYLIKEVKALLLQTRTDTIREVEELVDKDMPICFKYPDSSGSHCNNCFACRVTNHDSEMSFSEGYEYKQTVLHQELEQLKGQR